MDTFVLADAFRTLGFNDGLRHQDTANDALAQEPASIPLADETVISLGRWPVADEEG
jgi:hypothetical protein